MIKSRALAFVEAIDEDELVRSAWLGLFEPECVTGFDPLGLRAWDAERFRDTLCVIEGALHFRNLGGCLSCWD